ncbi:MAG: hypothetical protein VKJ02_11060 [Snowella sp.]|nr:hypothetical protein [Snowella sp.]
MKFDIKLLDNLDYDDVEPLLEDYIDTLIEEFIQSPEAQEQIADDLEEVGNWIYHFIDYGYRYEEFTLTKMTLSQVKTLMESLLPRKITILEKSDAEDAIPELVAFWSFLQREYQLKQAKGIIIYLRSIKDKFPDWMIDPARGGMAKNFFLSGLQQGFDMETQEGMNNFKDFFNAQLNPEKSLPTHQKQKPSPKKTKGFGAWTPSKSSGRKKKKK